MINKILITSLTTLLLSTSLLNADAGEMFVGATLGYTHQNVDQTDKIGAIILADSLKEDGYNLELRVGYEITQAIALSLSYQRSIQDITFQNNVYLNAEYKFENTTEITPFLGLNLGYSRLEYSKEPINTLNNDYVSCSWLVGASLGATYPLTKSIDLVGGYTLNLTDHKTQLESGSARSELTHNYSHNVNLGLRVYF